MLLHIGDETTVLLKNLILILDMSTALSPDTHRFLNSLIDKGAAVKAQCSRPRSLILCRGDQKDKIDLYFSPISSRTLIRRSASFKA